MEYGASDSSGTDDDLPPPYHQRTVRGGRISGNGRPVVNTNPYPQGSHDEINQEVHEIELDAYCYLLRAFKAQSDAITWEKEGLITGLRKELNISDNEHKDALCQADADEKIRRIRGLRQAAGPQVGAVNNLPILDLAPSPTVSASRKRQKTSHPMLPVAAQSPALHPQQFAPPLQPSLSVARKGASSAPKGKKAKQGHKLPAASTSKPVHYTSANTSGRGHLADRNSSGVVAAVEPSGVHSDDPLIGRRVMTRWPEDNKFYEAVITDYNPAEGIHLLVYDMHTANETLEWVNLREIKPEDLRWDGEDPGISQRGRGALGHGSKKFAGRNNAAPSGGRGRGAPKNVSKKEFVATQNGIGRKNPDDIEIWHTESLIKEVERVFTASHPDPVEIEKAKKVIKEHEQSLINAIARLAEASDGESDHGNQPLDVFRGRQKAQHGMDLVVGEGDGDRDKAPFD